MNTITVDPAVLEQALQTLQQIIDRQSAGGPTIHDYGNARRSAAALSNALAQEEQEPVAFADRISFDQAMKSGKGHDVWSEAGDYEARTGRKLRVLYTHPPRREWQSLSEEEIWNDDKIMAENAHCNLMLCDLVALCRAIETKLKEKNNG